MKRERLIRLILILIGIPAILLFLAAKSEYVMDRFTNTDIVVGDMSREVKITEFQVGVPPSVESDDSFYLPGMHDAELLLIGDSFFRWHRGGPVFAEQLSHATGLHAANLWPSNGRGYPQRIMSQLAAAGVEWSDTARVLIVECVERNLVRNYTDPQYVLEVKPGDVLKDDDSVPSGNAGGLVDLLRTIRYRWFEAAEVNYQFLLQNSHATTGMVELYTTMRYRWFDSMPGNITVYSADPVMLFYEPTIDASQHSYFYPHPDETVAAIAETIQLVQAQVLEQYNLQLVFLPIPNKITIAHDNVTDVPYDMLMPRLHDELVERSIPTIDLYVPFRTLNEIPYHATDTHWNQVGIDLTIQHLVELLAQRGFTPDLP
jgi:SGNH hydrolase-like domain, acetyltransferase AlgX